MPSCGEAMTAQDLSAQGLTAQDLTTIRNARDANDDNGR